MLGLRLRKIFSLHIFKVRNKSKKKFTCPICGYQGPFVDREFATGVIRHTRCPKCGSLERHRLQKLVLDDLLKHYGFSRAKVLHFAPESFLRKYLQTIFEDYASTDLSMKNVDFRADLRNLPLNDAEYDFVYASHVLEHIQEDLTAISEIRRILKPNGIAILPVPIIAEETIEYPEPNPLEWGHVRAPGFDYYDRYSKFFSHVETYSSKDFPLVYQTYVYEDRNNWPTKEFPLREPVVGEKHVDIVPVCFV